MKNILLLFILFSSCVSKQRIPKKIVADIVSNDISNIDAIMNNYLNTTKFYRDSILDSNKASEYFKDEKEFFGCNNYTLREEEVQYKERGLKIFVEYLSNDNIKSEFYFRFNKKINIWELIEIKLIEHPVYNK